VEDDKEGANVVPFLTRMLVHVEIANAAPQQKATSSRSTELQSSWDEANSKSSWTSRYVNKAGSCEATVVEVEEPQIALEEEMARRYVPITFKVLLKLDAAIRYIPAVARLNAVVDAKAIAGLDLKGNTFWEFKDALNANRLRRIVHYNSKAHHADIKISREFPRTRYVWNHC
jgi:hypothetical protein